MPFDSLIEDLADASQRIASARLTALSSMDAGQVEAFRDAWHSMDGDRRRSLTLDLRELAEDNVDLDFDPVFFLALGDSNPDVRREGIHGLWDHEGLGLVEPLLNMLEKDPDAGVRADAALALGPHVVRAEFGRLPQRLAERIENVLQQTFSDPTEPVEVRGRALESIGVRSEEWVRDLIDEGFASGDRRLEISAIHAMGRSADPSWLPSVLAQLESDDEEVRFEAATAAGSIGDPEAAPFLQPLLRDEDTDVQLAAIRALGEIGEENAKEALQELLAEGDERLADAITEALAEIEFAEDPLALQLQE